MCSPHQLSNGSPAPRLPSLLHHQAQPDHEHRPHPRRQRPLRPGRHAGLRRRRLARAGADAPHTRAAVATWGHRTGIAAGRHRRLDGASRRRQRRGARHQPALHALGPGSTARAAPGPGRGARARGAVHAAGQCLQLRQRNAVAAARRHAAGCRARQGPPAPPNGGHDARARRRRCEHHERRAWPAQRGDPRWRLLRRWHRLLVRPGHRQVHRQRQTGLPRPAGPRARLGLSARHGTRLRGGGGAAAAVRLRDPALRRPLGDGRTTAASDGGRRHNAGPAPDTWLQTRRHALGPDSRRRRRAPAVARTGAHALPLAAAPCAGRQPPGSTHRAAAGHAFAAGLDAVADRPWPGRCRAWPIPESWR